MENVLLAGLAAAFVLSVLEYWVIPPAIKATAGVAASAGSILLLGEWGWQVIPMALGATFLAALVLGLTARHAVELRRKGPRL